MQREMRLHEDKKSAILMYDVDKYFIEYFIYDAPIIKIVDLFRAEIQIFFKEICKPSNAKLSADQQNIFYQSGILNDDKRIDEYQICDQSVIDSVANLKSEMQIFAKTLDNKTFPIEIKNFNKIVDIKKKIEEKLGLHTDDQKIIFQAALLEDDKTVEYYQIFDKSVINVIARLKGGMQIFIKTMNGWKVTIETMKSDKIIDVKRKIQEKTGINPDEQILIYQGAKLDNDNKTIDECQICEKSVINVVPRLRNKIQIFANTRDGKIIAFKIDKSYKIIDIKYKIQEIIGLHPDEQILVFQIVLLEDDKTIDEYQICDQSVINIVDNYHIFILAKPVAGINNAIYVHKSFRIIDIKYKIQEKTGLQPNEQQLIYHDEVLNDNYKTLIEIGIDEKFIIDIVCKLINGMQLFIKTFDGSSVIIYVQKSDKISKVKLKIQEKLGLHPTEQKLSYRSRILSDDKTVDEYQIYNQSVIDIDAKQINSLFERLKMKFANFAMKLFAKIMNGTTISIYIRNKDKIKYIKWQIHFQTGLHPDLQKLVYNGVVLEDERLVRDYQISEQSTLNVFKMIEVFTKIVKWEIFSIYLLRTDNIGDVKCRIQERSGLHRDKQILFYKDKLLNDDRKTVNQYKITDISIIDVFVRLKDEIQIFLQTSNRSIIPINILKTAKIIDVKSKIAEKTGNKFEGNKLIYKNTILDDDKLLIDYKIDDGYLISIDESKFILFVQAIKSGSLEKVKSLYDNTFHGMKDERFSPIHDSCKLDNADIVKFLIENKFQINIIDQDYNMPIHYACINGCGKVLETLIQHKCNIEACDSLGMKPIHLACLNGNFQNVKLLIDNHCNLESHDYLKRRPIHLACLSGNIDIVKLLIENNCKINVLDQSNNSPFNIAEKENLTDIMEIMDEGNSRRMIEIMIKELNLKCGDNCDHIFCQTSLRNKTFIKGKKVGQGIAGKVYLCQLSQISRQIAAKKISKEKADSKNIEGNINRFMKKINHERIIKYFGAITKEENIFIFMEYMSKGSLKSQISANPPMTTSKVIHYTMQILEGLQFLHNNKIIHRDIKPDNILLDRDDNVKLTDLGLGLSLCATDGHTAQADTFCGTAYYMAPEIINGEKYSFGADIWALGATVIEMATGKRPYHELIPEQAIFRIGTTKTIPYQLPSISPRKMKIFLDRIIIPEPHRRLSATKLINILSIKN